MEVPAPKNICTKLEIPDKTLMGPGPSNYPDRVRLALSQPILGHFHPETFKIMDEVKEGIKYLFQTKNPLTFCISASGHAGMETALCNLIEDDDIVLVAISGIWGQRAADMARRHNADVRLITTEIGKSLQLETARNHFKLHKPKVFFVAHGESSTGMMQNLEGFGELCREFDCLFVVDSVITIGCAPFYADKWLIDVAYTGSQKVLNAPPGITPITFGERALKKIQARRNPVRVYNFDAQLIGEYWKCFDDRPRIYHHTICTTLLYGLREAISMFIEQGGLEASWKKHAVLSQKLYNELEKLGLEMFINDKKHRVPCVTSVKVPSDIDWMKISSYAMSKYKFEISGGLGPTANKIFRIGLMGNNCTNELVEMTAKIFAEAIQVVRNEKLSSKI